MRKTIFTFLIIMIGVLLCPSQGFGQTTVLTKAFVFTSADIGGTGEKAMSEISGFDGWIFDECSANYLGDKKDNYMQVGSSTEKGSFITPPLGVYGNMTLLIKTKRRETSSSAKFRVSVIGAGTTSSEEYVIDNTSEYRPTAILIKDCAPSSKIKIEGTLGKFWVKSIKVYSIEDALFYESFNYMEAGAGGEFYPNNSKNAEAAFCDNSQGVSFTNTKQSKMSIYFNGSSNFTMPTIPVGDYNNAIITFRISQFDISYNQLSLSCDGDARLTNFNSTDLTKLSSSRALEFRSGPYMEWQDYSVIVTGIDNTTVLTFGGDDICLDEIKVVPIPNNLDQAKLNNTFINFYNDKKRDVTLSRTLTPNIWCPLCLPFSITPSKIATDMGVSCEVRTLASVTDGVFSFNKVEAETAITAGTPFLIKVPSLVTNPTFRNVTVSNTPATVATGLTVDYKFIGTYSPVELNTDGTHLFLGTDGKLYKPGTGAGANLLGGLRAYFEVPAATPARIMINDEVSTVDNVRTATGQQLFDLYGRQVGNRSPKRGLYIVRPAEGRLQGKNGQKLIVK